MFGVAVFEAIEAKGQSMLNFEAATSKFFNHTESLAAELEIQSSDLFDVDFCGCDLKIL